MPSSDNNFTERIAANVLGYKNFEKNRGFAFKEKNKA